MKHVGVAAFAAVLMTAGVAEAADQPGYQWGPNSPVLPQTILVAPNAAGVLGVVGGDSTKPLHVTLDGASSGGTTTTTSASVRTNDTTSTTAAPRDQSHDDTLATAQAGTGLKVTDANNAAFQGVVAITPGTSTPALRSIGYVISTAGPVTLTLADASTITLTLPVGGFTTLPFAVTNVALGSGTAGSFWNLK